MVGTSQRGNTFEKINIFSKWCFYFFEGGDWGVKIEWVTFEIFEGGDWGENFGNFEFKTDNFKKELQIFVKNDLKENYSQS